MSLSRRYVEREEQPRSYFNPANGNFYSDISKLHSLGAGTSIKDALEKCDTPIIYVMPMEAGTYAHKESMYPKKQDLEWLGIEITKWYSKTGSAKVKIGDHFIDMYPLEVWFTVPVGTYLSDVVKTMSELPKLLAVHFQPDIVHKERHDAFKVVLQSTPANTGLDLLRWKLPRGVKYEPLPSDIEHILLTNFSQQRQELFCHTDHIEELYNYDGLWMYASCCRHMPVGRIIHDEENEYVPYVPGFYHVIVTVPMDWKHIGLLPMKNPDPVAKRSIYPNVPGYTFDSWCSDKELQIAKEYGWEYFVCERILWPDSQAKGMSGIGQDPLRHWMETLVKLRQEIILKYPQPVQGMLKDAIRQLLNTPIGKMSSTKRKVDVYMEDWDDDPGPNTHFIANENGVMHYTKNEQLSSYQQQTFQPHWVRYVWCLCKAKVTRAALQVPFENLVSIRTDGLWTTTPVAFENTGKPGCFREKDLVVRGPFEWPRNDPEFVDMITIAREGHN